MPGKKSIKSNLPELMQIIQEQNQTIEELRKQLKWQQVQYLRQNQRLVRVTRRLLCEPCKTKKQEQTIELCHHCSQLTS